MLAMFLGTEIDWQYRTVNESNACLSTGGSCGWPRGKNLGGTSVHNGMMYIRGHPKDYDDWAALGNYGWSWKDVRLDFFDWLYFTNSRSNIIDNGYFVQRDRER
jgi:choline dehydrogenase